MTSLPKRKIGRPLILGEEMDSEVQDFIRALEQLCQDQLSLPLVRVW